MSDRGKASEEREQREMVKERQDMSKKGKRNDRGRD